MRLVGLETAVAFKCARPFFGSQTASVHQFFKSGAVIAGVFSSQQENDVAGIRNGSLHPPGEGFDFFAQCRVLHDHKLPRLAADGAGRKPSEVKDGGKIFGTDFARRVVVADGNAAFENFEGLFAGQYHDDSFD